MYPNDEENKSYRTFCDQNFENSGVTVIIKRICRGEEIRNCWNNFFESTKQNYTFNNLKLFESTKQNYTLNGFVEYFVPNNIG